MNDVFARSREYVALPSDVGKVRGVSPIEVNSNRSGALTPQPQLNKTAKKHMNGQKQFMKRLA
jgi:hypothetical protein